MSLDEKWENISTRWRSVNDDRIKDSTKESQYKHSTKESVNANKIKDSKWRDARLNFFNTHKINSALPLATTIADFRLGQWIGCDSLSDEQERIVQSRWECTKWLFTSTVNQETGELTTYQTVLYVNIGTSDCTEYFAAFEWETTYHAQFCASFTDQTQTTCGSFSK